MIMSDDDLDYAWLDKQLDRVKTRVFSGRNAAFLGSVQCYLVFIWDKTIDTACTNGISIRWNPHHFRLIPKKTRLSVLVHEVWHVALMHMLRLGGRNPKLWNYACDIMINNMMERDGYSFEGAFPEEMGFAPGTKHWVDHSFGTMSAEEIYEIKFQKTQDELDAFMQMLEDTGYKTDLVDPSEEEREQGLPDGTKAREILSTVTAAATAAQVGGVPGNVPGEVTETLRRFLQPKLPWETLLNNWMNDLGNQDYTLRRPSRRSQEFYLPCLIDDHDALDHIAAFQDVSGSISQSNMVRFNSELKYLKDRFNPRLLTIVQFDYIIQKEVTFEQDEPFDEITLVGRGGTSLVPVRDWIHEHRPTAILIFSDLEVEPMKPLDYDIPTIWVAINNHNAQVNFGKLIHVRE